jgi:hypothetical protein
MKVLLLFLALALSCLTLVPRDAFAQCSGWPVKCTGIQPVAPSTSTWSPSVLGPVQVQPPPPMRQYQYNYHTYNSNAPSNSCARGWHIGLDGRCTPNGTVDCGDYWCERGYVCVGNHSCKRRAPVRSNLEACRQCESEGVNQLSIAVGNGVPPGTGGFRAKNQQAIQNWAVCAKKNSCPATDLARQAAACNANLNLDDEGVRACVKTQLRGHAIMKGSKKAAM